jgi:hypothetical protein
MEDFLEINEKYSSLLNKYEDFNKKTLLKRKQLEEDESEEEEEKVSEEEKKEFVKEEEEVDPQICFNYSKEMIKDTEFGRFIYGPVEKVPLHYINHCLRTPLIQEAYTAIEKETHRDLSQHSFPKDKIKLLSHIQKVRENATHN